MRSINRFIHPNKKRKIKLNSNNFNKNLIYLTLLSVLSIYLLYKAKQMGSGYSYQHGLDDPRVIRGDEKIMSKKEHGTCKHGPDASLRWNVDSKMADNICCYNRHYAEPSGYFASTTKHSYLKDIDKSGNEVIFYDSITRKPLFIAPRGRTYEEFEQESRAHGWPSFRVDEVVWENVRVLSDGECVSVDGTHLGHNIPDHKGARFCINLVCVAGMPPTN